jgi:hypothetical protein
MIYTVAEVSQQLDISKVSIYNKLKTKAFKNLTVKKQGRTYINDIGFNMIKNDLKAYEENVNDFKENEEANTLGEDIEPLEDLKNDYINFLKEQIKELNKKLTAEQELHKNTQILFKEQQPQEQLLLEEHFEDLDNKLEEVKKNMSERKEQQNKGFFSKIFNK